MWVFLDNIKAICALPTSRRKWAWEDVTKMARVLSFHWVVTWEHEHIPGLYERYLYVDAPEMFNVVAFTEYVGHIMRSRPFI